MIFIDEEKKKEIDKLQFQSLTRRQFKLALLDQNLLSKLEQEVEKIEDSTVKTRIEIEYADSEKFERTNESVVYMFRLLKLTQTKIDKFWTYAMSL